MIPTDPTLAIPAFIAALAATSSALVSALKGPLEELLLPTNRWHDLVFVALPYVFTLALALGYVLTQPGRHPASAIFMTCLGALLGGGGANSLYLLHTRLGAQAQQGSSEPATSTVVPLPPAQP